MIENADEQPTWNDMGTLERRKIEAEIIAHIYPEIVQEVGVLKAREIISTAIHKAAVASGRDFASRTKGGTSLKTFEDLQVLWTKDDALEVTVLEKSATRYDYDVHRCRYAETYKELGLGAIGHLLSCNRDGVFCEGYDPRIKLKRTQTIMQGASHCDFRYTMEEGGGAEK